MAILKHIASKNADYTETERYLTFQHDEDTGKKLGDAFEKAAVQRAILGTAPVTFDHSGQKSRVAENVIAGTEGIGRIIDLENNVDDSHDAVIFFGNYSG